MQYLSFLLASPLFLWINVCIHLLANLSVIKSYTVPQLYCEGGRRQKETLLDRSWRRWSSWFSGERATSNQWSAHNQRWSSWTSRLFGEQKISTPLILPWPQCSVLQKNQLFQRILCDTASSKGCLGWVSTSFKLRNTSTKFRRICWLQRIF